MTSLGLTPTANRDAQTIRASIHGVAESLEKQITDLEAPNLTSQQLQKIHEIVTEAGTKIATLRALNIPEQNETLARLSTVQQDLMRSIWKTVEKSLETLKQDVNKQCLKSIQSENGTNPTATTPLKSILTRLKPATSEIAALRTVLSSSDLGEPWLPTVDNMGEIVDREQTQLVDRLTSLKNRSLLDLGNRAERRLPAELQQLVAPFVPVEFASLNTRTQQAPTGMPPYQTETNPHIQEMQRNNATKHERMLALNALQREDARTVSNLCWFLWRNNMTVQQVFDEANPTDFAISFIVWKRISNFYASIMRLGISQNEKERTDPKRKELVEKLWNNLKKDQKDPIGLMAQRLITRAVHLFSGEEQIDPQMSPSSRISMLDPVVFEAVRRLSNNQLLLLNGPNTVSFLIGFFYKIKTSIDEGQFSEIRVHYQKLKESDKDAADLLAFAVGTQLAGDPSLGEDFFLKKSNSDLIQIYFVAKNICGSFQTRILLEVENFPPPEAEANNPPAIDPAQAGQGLITTTTAAATTLDQGEEDPISSPEPSQIYFAYPHGADRKEGKDN